LLEGVVRKYPSFNSSEGQHLRIEKNEVHLNESKNHTRSWSDGHHYVTTMTVDINFKMLGEFQP